MRKLTLDEPKLPVVMETMIRNLYAVDALIGCTEDEISFMKQMFGELPSVLENFYRTLAKTDALHHIQDCWMLPEHFAKYTWLNNPDCLIILNENQGVCQAGIRRADLNQQDPPVYVQTDDNEWVLSAPSTSEFLLAMLGYEAAFSMEFMPEEFYWITEEELAIIQTKLNKLPYEIHNWLYEWKISLYANASDNIVAVMDSGGDLQILYGANSEESYAKLMTVMDGIGEAM